MAFVSRWSSLQAPGPIPGLVKDPLPFLCEWNNILQHFLNTLSRMVVTARSKAGWLFSVNIPKSWELRTGKLLTRLCPRMTMSQGQAQPEAVLRSYSSGCGTKSQPSCAHQEMTELSLGRHQDAKRPHCQILASEATLKKTPFTFFFCVLPCQICAYC